MTCSAYSPRKLAIVHCIPRQESNNAKPWKFLLKSRLALKIYKAQFLKNLLNTIPILPFPRSKSDNLNASNDNNSSPRINLMSQPAATCSAYSPTKLAIVLRIPPQESNRKKTPRFCLLTDKMGLMKWIWKHLLPSHSSRMKTMPARSWSYCFLHTSVTSLC